MKEIKLTKGEDYVIFSKQKMAADYLGCKTSSFSTYKNSGKCKGFSIEEVDSEDRKKVNNKYSVDKKGRIENNNSNVEVFLRQNCGTFRFNEFLKMNEIDGKEVTDELYKTLNSEMDKQTTMHDIRRLEEEVTVLCRADSYHPLIEMLEETKWDGIKRAETFFIDYAGADDTTLNRKYTMMWMKAAVKRLYEPGCFFDNMLILQDRTHGTGKTKLFERLSFNHVNINPDISNKDIVDQMNRTWFVNFDELAQFDSASMNRIKTFLSGDADSVRKAYAKNSETSQRHIVFCGTTNYDHFLRDYTAERERRFWIMECHGKYIEKDEVFWNELLSDDTIRQIWAEVIELYRKDSNLSISRTAAEVEEEVRIHISHKSYGSDPKSLVAIESLLESNYSGEAMCNVKQFIEETRSSMSYGSPIQKVRFDWIASRMPVSKPDYVKAVIIHHGGWHIEYDGKNEWIVRNGCTLNQQPLSEDQLTILLVDNMEK